MARLESRLPFFNPRILSIPWSAKCPDSPSSPSDADNTTSLVMSGAKLRIR
jgi:hypothetical protein